MHICRCHNPKINLYSSLFLISNSQFSNSIFDLPSKYVSKSMYLFAYQDFYSLPSRFPHPSVQFSHSVMSNSLGSHRLQDTRLPPSMAQTDNNALTHCLAISTLNLLWSVVYSAIQDEEEKKKFLSSCSNTFFFWLLGIIQSTPHLAEIFTTQISQNLCSSYTSPFWNN